MTEDSIDPTRPAVLVVDDDSGVRKLLTFILRDQGYDITTAANGAEALEHLKTRAFNLVFEDYQLPDTDGLAVLKEAGRLRPGLPVVMMSGFGTIKLAVEATRQGAYDFLEKPLDADRVIMSARHALEQDRLRREVALLKSQCGAQFEMVGTSSVMQQLQAMIDRVAPSKASVLILGESGVGKELVARAIHDRSSVAGGPFIRINCAAIPQELIESELFGHEKGSFTGAIAQKPGKMELAHTGTVFLDEIGDMNLYVQAKLLRFLQEGEFERVGGTRTMKVDVRTIAATNKDIAEEIKQHRFREDLYYRLNVVTLKVLPLRDRPDDISLLARHFLTRYCAEHGVPQKTLSDDAVTMLKSQPWPGNVRELANVIQRCVVMVPTPDLTGADVESVLINRAESATMQSSRSLRAARDEFERGHILATIAECQGNLSEAARVLDVERTSLYRMIERLGLKVPEH